MIFSNSEERINAIPPGIVPLYDFLDFILNWYDQSSEIECIVNSDEYGEIINSLQIEMSRIFPDYITRDFLDFITLLERQDGVDVFQVSESIGFIELQIDQYYESREMLYSPQFYENSEVEDLDNSILFNEGFSDYCKKQIERFCRKIHASIYAMEIREYILDRNYPVDKSDLVLKFGQLNKFMVSLVMSKGDIINYRGSFFATKNIEHDENTRTILGKILEDEHQHSATEIYQVFLKANNAFLKRNYIASPLQLYMVLAHIYAGDFNFSWPFVSVKTTRIRNQNELIIDYISSKAVINVVDLLQYAREKGITFPSTIEFLDSLNGLVLLKNKHELFPVKELNLGATDIRIIKKLIIQDIQTNRGEAIRDLTITHKFPVPSVLWNEWLVYSVVKKYIPDLCVSLSSTQFGFSVPVVALTHQDLIVAREKARRKYSNTRVEQVVFAVDDLDDIDNLIADYLEFELDEELI